METPAKTTKSKTKFQKFKSIFSTVLLIAIVALAVYVGYMRFTGHQVYFFGYRPGLILSGSMEPYMKTHSICLTKQIDSPDDVEVGDVVSYILETSGGGTTRITHRVIAIDNGMFYTKGDNNDVTDGYPISFESLEAEVVGVWNGAVPLVNLIYWFSDQWNEPGISGKAICICGAVAVICGYNLICMICEAIWSLFKRKVLGIREDENEHVSCENTVPSDNSEPVERITEPETPAEQELQKTPSDVST